MNSSNLVNLGLATEPLPGLSKAFSRLSLLTAVVASQAYSIQAIFFGHALRPVSVYVIDRQTHLRLLSGQIGSIQEVFHWDGMLPTMLISVLVFVAAWMAARGTAKLLAKLATERVVRPNSSIPTPSSYSDGGDLATVSTEGVA